MNISNWLTHIDRLLVKLALLIGSLTLVFVCLFGTINVVLMRKLLNSPVQGTEDLMIVAMIVFVAMAIPFGGRCGAHIEIEVLDHHLPKSIAVKSRASLRLLASFTSFCMAIVLLKAGHKAAAFGETTQQLLIPYQPFYYCLAAGLGIYAVILLLDVYQLLSRGDISELQMENNP